MFDEIKMDDKFRIEKLSFVVFSKKEGKNIKIDLDASKGKIKFYSLLEFLEKVLLIDQDISLLTVVYAINKTLFEEILGKSFKQLELPKSLKKHDLDIDVEYDWH